MIIGVREVMQSLSAATCTKLGVPVTVEPAEYRRGMRRKRLLALLVTQHAKGAVDQKDLQEYIAVEKCSWACGESVGKRRASAAPAPVLLA